MIRCLAALGILLAAVAAGCTEMRGERPAAAVSAAPRATSDEKEFNQLYRQYSARFYEQMTPQEAESKTPVEVTTRAARIWDEVFGPHKDLVRRRQAEILDELQTAPPLAADQFDEVWHGSRADGLAALDGAVILKQFLWSPVSAAHMGLNNCLARILDPKAFAIRSAMTASAAPEWGALDRNPDRPKLMLRQGPMVYIVQLSRNDDYYQVDNLRWLRPKRAIAAPAQ